MKFIIFCNKIIEYSFYALFFFVPLVFLSNTSELFELNKMWLAFILTIIISLAWVAKMIAQKRLAITKTPLDIPIFLFLISQIISTFLSLDTHISLWGYYSRFNGGLFSTIAYLILYYAFVSNLQIKHAYRTLTVSLISGLLVALWGFPSHFGYDPTCLIFRGTLDTSCWTDAFKPTIRIFSTLGQPAWLAAYLSILLPLSIVYGLNNIKSLSNWKLEIGNWKFVIFYLLTLLFYLCLVFTNTRAGFAAFWIANVIFWPALYFKKLLTKETLLRWMIIFNVSFLILNFFFGSPIGQLDKFTFPQLITKFTTQANSISTNNKSQKTTSAQNLNITDSGMIRLLVWRGAIDAWKKNPIFGTGVETFAFAYYRFRPPEHNLTSEWDYLYNKAHNEYLNYLTTTGIIGLGTYLSIIALFLFQTIKYLYTKSKSQNLQHSSQLNNKMVNVSRSEIPLRGRNYIFVIALLAGYITILISNFFGFSVVIINLYFFLIPAFVFILGNQVDSDRSYAFSFGYKPNTSLKINLFQWTGIVITLGIAGYMIFGLVRYWVADIHYALGSNLDHSAAYQQAYPELVQAVSLEPNEPVYRDEIAVNLGTLAGAFYMQKDTSSAGQLAKEAISIDDQVTNSHPNNVVFWKDRIRLFYTLSESDLQNQSKYLSEALRSATIASRLAPTDAKISYNLGVLLGQTGETQQAINVLNTTVRLKPDYRDAYFALGLIYHEAALDKNGKITDPAMQQKAVETYQFILKNLSPDDDQVKKELKSWTT